MNKADGGCRIFADQRQRLAVILAVAQFDGFNLLKNNNLIKWHGLCLDPLQKRHKAKNLA